MEEVKKKKALKNEKYLVIVQVTIPHVGFFFTYKFNIIHFECILHKIKREGARKGEKLASWLVSFPKNIPMSFRV